VFGEQPRKKWAIFGQLQLPIFIAGLIWNELADLVFGG
jgi:hypothetical protein